MNVVAPMPASVIEVLVAVGDSVTEEQELLIVESMKMEVPVTAPGAGTVASIEVAEGDTISEGQVLIVLS